MNSKISPAPAKKNTRLFGILSVHHDRTRQTVQLKVNFSRLAVIAGGSLVALYLLGVAAGFIWLRQGRGLKEVSVWDVAFLQRGAVRQKIGREQLRLANAAWKAGQYQAAYLAYSAGLHNAPDESEGRLDTADFLVAAGAANLAVNTLEDGLKRQPGNEILIKRLLDLFTTTGRDQDALKLIRGLAATGGTSAPADVLHTYELSATLATEGVAPARRFLDLHPELRRRPLSGAVVARVLWETKERLAAIEVLQAYTLADPKDYSGYAKLVQYQQAAGLLSEAQESARRACAQLPGRFEPLALRIATLSPGNPAEFPQWKREIERYLAEFRARPEAVAFLGEVAGRLGWVDLSRSLYETACMRGVDARTEGLFYADALLAGRRPAEAMGVLAALDRQMLEAGPAAIALRQRQVIGAAALGAREDVRQYARQLAVSLNRDPERLAKMRERFLQLGIADAVAELSGSSARNQVAAKK